MVDKHDGKTDRAIYPKAKVNGSRQQFQTPCSKTSSASSLCSAVADDGKRLDRVLAQERDSKEKALVEAARLRERQSAILGRLKEAEAENETLKQRLAFTQEKINLWRTQLLSPVAANEEEEQRTGTCDECEKSNKSHSASSTPIPTAVRGDVPKIRRSAENTPLDRLCKISPSTRTPISGERKSRLPRPKRTM